MSALLSERIESFNLPASGERLDKALTASLPHLSRTQLQRLIAEGQVTLDGQVVTKVGARIERATTVEVRIPPPAPTGHIAQAIPLEIVYEDASVLVVNKPAGMVVHPAVGHADGTLVNAVLGHDPELEGVGDEQRPGIVHRLDKDTSGLIIVAKTDAAHRALQQQFKARTVEKRYLALVEGHPPTPTGRIEAAVGRDPHDRKRMALVPEIKGGRFAITEYQTRERLAYHTLLDVNLLTGRTHQIRLHLAYLKCPIVGDKVYGRRTPSVPLARHFLHAARLVLRLPSTNAEMTFEAPLPPDLQQCLELLRL